ncbi:MAG TPA: O-antigen ligase family protein, partial [Thermomonas sp.]|nr:O-antigen ligase family protein [Thermomonas sp.]
WALLPAIAAFLAALALDGQGRRLLVKAVIVLVGCNVLFAFFQAGLPEESPLRLYGTAGFGGLLVNTNHQGTALVIALALATGQAVHARRRARAGRAGPRAWMAYAAIAVACLLLVPLTTSRAAMALALPAAAAAFLLAGGIRRGGMRGKPLRMAALAGMVVVAAIGIHAALGWMAVDQAEEIRHSLTATTLDAARGYAPWGSGIGSFIPVFAEHAPPALWLPQYVNHAHNEYAQWWLTAGVPGLLALLLVVGVLGAAAVRVVRANGRDGHAILAASCLVAVAAVLAHSAVDFPLRTLTLMTTVGALAGAMLGALADIRAATAVDPRPHPDLAPTDAPT